MILYSVQCCYALYWTDNNNGTSVQRHSVGASEALAEHRRLMTALYSHFLVTNSFILLAAELPFCISTFMC